MSFGVGFLFLKKMKFFIKKFYYICLIQTINYFHYGKYVLL